MVTTKFLFFLPAPPGYSINLCRREQKHLQSMAVDPPPLQVIDDIVSRGTIAHRFDIPLPTSLLPFPLTPPL